MNNIRATLHGSRIRELVRLDQPLSQHLRHDIDLGVYLQLRVDIFEVGVYRKYADMQM